MRISDWSSDVCSSDLTSRAGRLKRALSALSVAPRAGGGGDFGTPTCCAQYWNKSRTIFMLAQAGHQFHEVAGAVPAVELGGQYAVPRSEEHTSELQSLMRISYAVFCLKKKKQINYNKNTIHISSRKMPLMIKIKLI